MGPSGALYVDGWLVIFVEQLGMIFPQLDYSNITFISIHIGAVHLFVSDVPFKN